MEAYIKHYGVDGQEWGKRNGPPYPLDPNPAKQKIRKQKSSQKINTISRASTQAIASSRSLLKAKRKKPDFSSEYKSLSNEELSKYINRRTLEARYSDIRAKEIEKPSRITADDVMNIIGVATGVTIAGLTLSSFINKPK